MAFRAELADFESFYERTYPGAYRTALAIVRDPSLASDVTQDAYVKAYRERDRFRGDAPVAAWLHRIVVNEALSGVRKQGRRPREIDMTTVWDLSAGSGDVARVSDRLSILDALHVLTPRARAAVVLRYYHDHDYATIARILGTSTGNVGALLSRSLDRLRIELEPTPRASSSIGDPPVEVRDER
jgi:RNA polymerase sigma-70 factor (ECF subfamily)